jgi:hypothetical protein
MGQPAIYSEALCEKMMACVRLAFGVWRSAFGVWPLARAGTRRVRVGETTAKTAQNRRGRFAERTILPARPSFSPYRFAAWRKAQPLLALLITGY